MKRIIISTSISKANDCQREGEPNFGNQINGLIGNLESKKIIKYDVTELYFLIDTYNGKENIGFQFDFENDALLYHNISIQSSQEFVDNFVNKQFAIHNENSLYRKVYEVFFNNNTGKFDTINNLVFPNINPQIIGQIGGQFLENGGIEIERIKNILGKSYNVEVENLINQNLNYHQKKVDKSNTKEDDNQNNENWYVLEKMLKSSNG